VSYVLAAYGITALVIGGYVFLLRRERDRLEREE
jgi:CcmD family protein